MLDRFFPGRSFLGGVVLFFCGLLGCQQPGQPIAPSPNIPTSDSPSLSPNQRAGRVAWVSPNDPVLVIELDPYLDLSVGGRLVVRLANGGPKGIVQITGMGHGRYRTAQLLGGRTDPGDEVIAPGPELRAWGDALPPLGK